MNITSRDNSLLCRARAVRDGRDEKSIFVEGLRLCEEALRSGLEIEVVVYSEQIAKKKRAAELIRELERVASKSGTVNEKLLASIAYTKTPQGVVVLAARPSITEKEFKRRQPANPLLMILHGINNPVNVGAIVRTAEAAGATGVVTTAGTADPFSPKSLRGAMGSAFRLPFWVGEDYPQVIKWCRQQRIQIVCASAEGAESYTEIDWRRPTALVMGSESHGLTTDEISAADRAVSIPMKGSTESLNVAVAAGILLYEASRQR
ncbi:MAG TPA: RNA methyltransferase [Pyrinomonadaceae bacterium]|nr:RNA methyltransferase [Pyrinomonadaceae bacterium]